MYIHVLMLYDTKFSWKKLVVMQCVLSKACNVFLTMIVGVYFVMFCQCTYPK